MFGQSLLSAFGSAVACTTDTDQLFATDVQTTSVATYQLNNATTSIPNNTYPGTASNITYAAGKFGDAAVFNGSNNRITATNVTGFPSGNSARSVSVWVKQTVSNVSQSILMWGTGASNQAFVLYPNGTQLTIATYGAPVPTGYNFTLNQWTHIVVTHDGTTTKVYADNSLVHSFTYTYNTSTANFVIGNVSWGNEPFTGQVDQVRIFNSALPQAAVTALYNETTTTATYDYVEYEVPNPNSVAYYKMSDATDQLGNYNGTATNVNFNTEGKFGFAGAFNGSSSRIAIPNIVNQAADHSVSIWIKPTNFSAARAALSMFNGSHCLLYVTTDAGINVGGGSTGQGTTAGTITANAWNHVTLIYNYASTTYTIYVNGINRGTGGSFNFSGRPNSIGCHHLGSGFGYWFDGSIDQIRIYDSALSAENVTALYNEIECPAVAVTNAFNTVLYTGNGSTQPISTVGFQPDLVFLHWRNTGNARNPIIFDSVRGVTKYLKTNTNEVQATLSTTLTSFNINGFSIGSSAAVNENNSNWVAWNWKAGGNSNTFNIDGTGYSTASAAGLDGGNINPTGASINKASGFGIYTASPTTASQSISHGLDSAPEMYIFKTTNVTRDWYVSVNVGGTWKFGTLNTTAALSTTTAYTANSNTMVIGGGSSVNEVVYAFTSVPGYSRIGSYVGNGSATGPVVYLGFEPAFVMIKKTDATGAWSMFDNKRDPSNPVQKVLQAQSNAAEANVGNACNFNSNNFQLTDTNSQRNANGGTYIFIAIA